MNKLIKVYGWRNIHTDEWYIGQTSQTMKRRIHSGYESCKKFYEAINEWGWPSFEENILRLCTSREEADYWEKYYIEKYNSIEKGYNISHGVHDGNGHIWTEEERQERSDRMSGERNPYYGKHHSEEIRKKMSENNAMKGFLNAPWISRKVYQFTKDGQLIAEYPSAAEASRQNGIHRSSIFVCCKGKRKTAKGFRWMYASDYKGNMER